MLGLDLWNLPENHKHWSIPRECLQWSLSGWSGTSLHMFCRQASWSSVMAAQKSAHDLPSGMASVGQLAS